MLVFYAAVNIYITHTAMQLINSLLTALLGYFDLCLMDPCNLMFTA